MTTPPYRDAAIALWGEAGAYAHDRYAANRGLYPELPHQLPITIGLIAYGHCGGLTRTNWEHGPRVTIFSALFAGGRERVNDLIVHEMLHCWLYLTGRDTGHNSNDWYAAVNRLSPVVIGRELGAKRGGDRQSVRVPNPDYDGHTDKRRTVVRKVPVPGAIPHDLIAGWPASFRPPDYNWGEPIACPSY